MRASLYRHLAAGALLCLLGTAAQAQVSLTATGGTSSGSFSTLNAAFAAINAGTHTGSIVITITGNTTEPSTPTPLASSGTGSASYTKILIKPSGNDTINSASSPASSRGIIELAGADNVTIDGDDPSTTGTQNLTIMAATSSSSDIACIRLGSTNTSGTGGASNDTIRNCVIIGSRNSATTSTTTYGIQFNSVASSNTSTTGAYANQNVAIVNNTIMRCYYGIYAVGNSSTYPNTGLLVDGNTIGSSTATSNVEFGIYLSYTASSSSGGAAVIRNNDIRVGGGSGISTNIAAVYLYDANYGAQVNRNNIHDVANPQSGGWGAYGIAITSSSNNSNISIYNNFIRDITTTNYSTGLTTSYQNYGIYVNSGVSGLKINHNTIYLNAANATNYGTNNEVSACINITSSSASVSQLLNNILVNNQGTASSNAYCIITAGSGNLSSGTVNNNDLYVNGGGSIGYYNGATQTSLAAWRTATGKDANSLSLQPAFTSTTDLHIPTSTNSQLESAGAATSTTGITTDIDGQTRPGPTGSTNGGGTAPDIGADEFDGVPVRAPSLSNLTTSAVSCTGNVAHTVSATIVANSGTISSVTVNYNNGSAGTATMSLSSGTSSNGVWTGTIPAAASAGTTVTWSVTATSSIPLSTTVSGPSYQDNPLAGVTASAFATPSSVCTGSSTVLKTRAYILGNVQLGTGATTRSSSGSPFYHGWGGAKVQYIYTAAELHAAGLDSGNITALGLNVTNVGTSYSGFTVSIGSTTQNSFSSASTINTVSAVYTNSSYTPSTGTNTFSFSSPFYWNGSDNIVVSICWSNNNTGGSSTTVEWDTYSSDMGMYIYADNQTVSTVCGATGAIAASGGASTIAGRPVTIFSGVKAVPVSAYSWSNGTSTVGTTNPLTATPTGATTYTATLTGAGNCTITTNGAAVTLLPLPTAPTATNSTQCGAHVPTASVSGAASGSTYRWYSAATGGTLLQNGGSTYTGIVTATTTFYVAIFNGQCESVRTPVTVTVTAADAITASTVTMPACLNSPLSLSVAKAAGSNTYTYSWTASPAAGSGMSGTVSGASPVVTPTAIGSYVYTVTGVDGACAAVSSVTVNVLLPPPAPSVTPTAATAFCLGGSQALTATPGKRTIFRDTFETFPLTQWTTTGSGVTTAQNTTYYKEGNSAVHQTYTSSAAGELTMTNSISLAGMDSAWLTFYHICATEAGYDYGYVQYSTDNGSTWTSFPTSAYLGSGTLKNSVVSFDKSSYSDWSSQFTSSSVTPGTGPATALWKLEKIDLSAYKGYAQFKVRFRLTSDGSLNYYGWLIDSAAIYAIPTVTYVWSSSPTGFSATTQNATATPAAAGTYTFTAAAIGVNGCRTSASTANVVVRPLPNFSFTPANAAICYGQSVTITASGASTYSWSPATGLNTTTGATVTANPTSTTNYKVIGTTSLGCVDSTIKTVTVNPLPIVTVTPAADTICMFRSSTLTASGATTYAWSPAAGLNATTGAVVSASPTANATYKVIGTDLNGCKDSATTAIVVKPLPNVSIAANANSTICGSGGVALTASGAVSYTWSPSSGLNTTTGSSVTASPAVTTIYEVTGTGANGCSNTDTQAVLVFPLPTVSVSPSSAVAVCPGYSTTLTASGANTYSWTPATGLSASTGATVTATPPATTTYTVTGTDVHGCSSSVAKVVTVNPGPTVSVNPATAVICAGDSIVLTASGTATGYSWSPATGLNTTTGATVVAKPSATTTYSVVGAGSGSGCSTLVRKVVTVNPLPVVSISPATAAICAGSSVTLTAGGASTYSWSPASGLSATTGTSVSASPAATTTYTVTGTDANGCVNAAQRNVVVHPLPTVTISPSSASVICFGANVTMTANGATTYAWTPGTGLSGTIGATVTASPGTTTTYTVTGTDNFGCTDTAKKTITVNQKPIVTINPTVVTVCAGHGDTLTAGGASTYSWTPTTGLSGATGATVFARPSISTSYTVTGTDTNGCTNTATRLVTVLPVPNVTTTANTTNTLCPGDSVHITAFGAVSYFWYPSGTLSASTGAAVWAYPAATTTYSVVGTAANGCTDTAQRTVTAYPKPDASIIPPGYQSICQYDSITLKAVSGYASYTWMIYGVPIAPATGSMLTTGTGGFYTLQVTDLNGCMQVTPQPTVITVVQRPVPAIRQEGAWLDAGPGYLRYQWYLAGAAVPGADSQWYLPARSGAYSVEVTADTITNCPGKSQEFMYDAVGVDGNAVANAIRLYPNPATDIVRIESPVPLQVSVTGMEGKLMFQGSEVKQLSVAGWPDGIYQVTLRNSKGSFIKAMKLTKLSR